MWIHYIKWLVYLLPVIAFVYWLTRFRLRVFSHWSQGFDNMKFSTEDFYKSTEQSLTAREIPGVYFDRVDLHMKLRTIIFDARQEYLCACREDHEFRICAAPIGTGFFVSWWLFERERRFVSILRWIPIVRWFVDKRTFYQVDMAEMFQTFAHTCVMEAVDSMTSTTGYRALSEYERRIGKETYDL